MFVTAQTELVTEVKWPFNGFMLRASQYKIDIPNGVPSSAVRMPNYVDVPGLSAVLRSGSNLAQGAGGQLGSVKGLVTAKLGVKFSDAPRQWKSQPLRTPNQGPVEFAFQGGKVNIEMALGIYVLNTAKPIPGDAVSEKVFSIVYSHELLHVQDYLEMINQWFLPLLKQNKLVNEYLIRRQPYVYGRISDSPRQLIAEFPEFIRNKIETEAHNLWTTEANRRREIRDAPVEYRKLQDKIDDLQSSRTMRRR